jgi:hypothetical protein
MSSEERPTAVEYQIAVEEQPCATFSAKETLTKQLAVQPEGRAGDVRGVEQRGAESALEPVDPPVLES